MGAEGEGRSGVTVGLAETSGLIRVAVNGEARELAAGSTVATLLAALGLPGGKVAVERNEAIVPRSTYATVRLEPGDQLEIVHFIGGG